jgi:hypothetical protein
MFQLTLGITAVIVDGALYKRYGPLPGGSLQQDPIYNRQQQQQRYHNDEFKDYRHKHQYHPFPITLVYGAITNSPIRSNYPH